MSNTEKPLVAIVGRPNVGKSTLFNRIAGQGSAIVSEIAGTTRDRLTIEAAWENQSFLLVDTGGLDTSPETELWYKVKSQIDVAITEANVIIVVVDNKTGLTAADRDVANALRKTNKPMILAANKADNDKLAAESVDFYQLGLGDPIPISAYHNHGIDDLMTRVASHLAEIPAPETYGADLRMAIVGRTNAGKSMLLNSLSGQERAIVSDIPGTTRDSVDTLMTFRNRTLQLVDTAGIRRRGRVEPGIERYSVLRALRAIDRADISVLLLDVTELATSQDTHIASYILEGYKGFVVAINKWDLAKSLLLTKDETTKKVRERFKFASFVPICYISALRGTGTDELIDKAYEVHSHWGQKLPRYDLRRTILNAVAAHPPATSGRRALKIYGVTQDQVEPPSFTFYVNSSDMVHFSYQRYLENTLRNTYNFEGSPLKMRFKGRGE